MSFAETLDTPENRFVKFAFRRWREAVERIHATLSHAEKSYPIERGIRETEEVLELLDSVLGEPFFSELGDMTLFPASSVVLAQRSGYREIYRAYLQFEVAATLAWQGGDDIYGAGQRDVATLYEFWCFLELVKILRSLCDAAPLTTDRLLERTVDGLSVQLKRGRQLVLEGVARRLGQQLKIELFFNKSFSPNGNQGDGAWTRLMRPDCTICVSAEPQAKRFSTERVWLHFDAKYSVDSPIEMLGPDVPSKEEGAFLDAERISETRGQYRRVDLLKMHAYRDAIRRSTGAYILFPGDEIKGFAEFFEILPGIGVFPLRPTEMDIPEGAPALENFLNQVLDHLASQLTEHARGSYWNRIVFEGEHREAPPLDFLGFLSKAPADTRVLVVAINSNLLHDWVLAHGLLVLPRLEEEAGNLPILAINLGIDLVLMLSGAEDVEVFPVAEHVKILTESELRDLSFPSPVPSAGLAVEIVRPGHRAPQLDASKVRAACFASEGESASYRMTSRSLMEIIRASTSD